MRQRSPRRANPIGQELEPVSHGQLIGKQSSNVEDPSRRGNVLARQLGRKLVVDGQDGEDLEGRDAVQNDNEGNGKDEIKRGALVQPRRASGTARRWLIHRFPCLSQQWVKYQEARHDGEVAAKRAVLRI